jgi:hypothetical protein
MWSERTNVLLLRKGRMLIPSSRLRYRWTRIRVGKAIPLGSTDVLTGVLLIALRLITIPVLTLVDYLLWPVALVTVARGNWYVVALGFNDVDPTLDRIAEAETFDEIKQRRRELERSAP